MSLRHAILALLTVEKGSGYDLVKRFNQSIRYFWASPFQQIYRELQSLEDAHRIRFEAVEQSGKPDKKVYELNAEGLEELKLWLEKPAKTTTLKEPLLIKIFAGALADETKLMQEICEHEIQHRATLEEYLRIEQNLMSAPEPSRSIYQFPYQTLKMGIELERAWLHWCEDVKATLPGLYENLRKQKAGDHSA